MWRWRKRSLTSITFQQSSRSIGWPIFRGNCARGKEEEREGPEVEGASESGEIREVKKKKSLTRPCRLFRQGLMFSWTQKPPLQAPNLVLLLLAPGSGALPGGSIWKESILSGALFFC